MRGLPCNEIFALCVNGVVVEAALGTAAGRQAPRTCYAGKVSPTVFREGKYRGFFFSREETRMHVHMTGPDGEAKFWLEPVLALATHTGMASRELKRMQTIVEEHHGEIVRAWRKHFG